MRMQWSVLMVVVFAAALSGCSESVMIRSQPTGAQAVNEKSMGTTPVVHLHSVLDLSDDQFFDFCQINRDLRIERSAHGECIVLPPTGGETREVWGLEGLSPVPRL